MADSLEPPEASFRRLAPSALLAALGPGGAFHDLVELSNSHPDLDLHLRALGFGQGDPKGHATLYLGLTKVLDLHQRGDHFWISTSATTKTFGPVCVAHGTSSWRVKQTLGELDEVSSKRGLFINDVIEAEGTIGKGRWTKGEGATQSALSRLPEHLVLIDRECVIQHPNGTLLTKHLAQTAHSARAAAKAMQPKNADVKRFGNELDAIAVDPAGRVLVIEVKDGKDTAGVGWTPAQVSVYLRMFRAWVDADPEAAARDLRGMLRQRQAVGLEPAAAAIKTPLRLVPVVVLKAPLKNEQVALSRFKETLAALAEQGETLDRLELWTVDDDSVTKLDILAR
jgi:hypothetical protein